MNDGSHIKSLENAMEVLLALPVDRSISVTELSKAVALSKSAVCKILRTLRDYGMVSQDPVTREYTLGYLFISKGYQVLEHLDIRKQAKPELKWLTDKYEENSMLMLEKDGHAIAVELCRAAGPFRMMIELGQLCPLNRGAGPKVLLAYQSAERKKIFIKR